MEELRDVLQEASTLLERRNMCYTGHSTMLVPSRLWKVSKSVRELIDTVDVWLLTLEKRGCASLLKAGAVGVADAFALSLFASKYASFWQPHFNMPARVLMRHNKSNHKILELLINRYVMRKWERDVIKGYLKSRHNSKKKLAREKWKGH